MPEPTVVWRGEVLPEWIDHNGHMNSGYYMIVFDAATGPWTAHCGFDDKYREDHPYSTFSVEGHITWERELRVGARIRVDAQLLGFDDKKLHSFFRLVDESRDLVASSHELLTMHVDLRSRRSAPFDAAVRERLTRVLEAHRELGWPEKAGRVIATKSSS